MLLGAGLLFWGWQAGLWLPASAMALVLEAARGVRFRWDFSARELNRAADLCALLFAGMAAYLFFAGRTIFVVFRLLEWLPASLFPLIFCQIYGIRDDVDIQAVSLFVRSRRRPRPVRKPVRIDLSFPYFGLCLLAAGFANRRDGTFYPVFLVLAGWALAVVRPRRASPVPWAIMLTAAALGGFAGQQGLHRLQQYLELKGMELFADLRGIEGDPFRSITGIGDILERKPSGRILFRVVFPEGTRPPVLLREAAYNRYHSERWFALNSPFAGVASEFPGDRWPLGPTPPRSRTLRVFAPLDRGNGMLKLPIGAFRVTELPAESMERNGMGAVRVRGGPGLTRYVAAWGETTPLDEPPRGSDLEIPPEEAPAIAELADALSLAGRSATEAGNRVRRHFLSEFAYDLDGRHRRAPTFLADFLTRNRVGHCEYFATAAVLLLRRAGIPARYAVGFSAHEYSETERTAVVRDRHAHAWALFWDGERWRELDPTPPDWRPREDEAASPLERFGDVWAWLHFRFQRWRWRPDAGGAPIWTLWLLLPPALYLLRRLAGKRRIRRSPADDAPLSPKPAAPGADSPFYRIEARLAEHAGIPRGPGEPPGRWLERLAETRPEALSPPVPDDLLRLHYRYRFGPSGLTEAERERLEAGVGDWLDRNEAVGDRPRV